MSLDYDDAYRRARAAPPFANGTDGSEWVETWCGTCARDAPHRDMGRGAGCPLVLVALCDRTPAEWLDGPRDSLAGRYVCLEYRRRGGGGSGEPQPRPEPPGMNGLFPRPPRQVRMPVLPHEEVTSCARQSSSVAG